jgi:flagellar basal-body rod protein FlgF
MSDGLYVGMNGAAARLLELDAIADNLANANTPGFKAERPAFAHVLGKAVNGSAPAVDHIHAVAVGTALDLKPGQMMTTGRPLDVAPEGQGFLAVQLENGSVGYTRQGSLQVDQDGRLTSHGRPVLGSNGAIILVPQGTAVQVVADGTVRAGEVAVGQLAVFELSGPIDRLAPGLLGPGQSGSAIPVESRFRTGELEQSNVNPLDMTVELIGAQRHFENAMQALSTYRRMDDRLSEVARVR